MRTALALLLLCTVLLACIYSASADYADDVLAGVEREKREEEQFRRSGTRPKGPRQNLTDVLYKGMGEEMRGIAEGCRAAGCRDFVCCTHRRSLEFKENPLVMQVLKDAWNKMMAGRKDEL